MISCSTRTKCILRDSAAIPYTSHITRPERKKKKKTNWGKTRGKEPYPTPSHTDLNESITKQGFIIMKQRVTAKGAIFTFLFLLI
jgi:hypothetical protein